MKVTCSGIVSYPTCVPRAQMYPNMLNPVDPEGTHALQKWTLRIHLQLLKRMQVSKRALWLRMLHT